MGTNKTTTKNKVYLNRNNKERVKVTLSMDCDVVNLLSEQAKQSGVSLSSLVNQLLANKH